MFIYFILFFLFLIIILGYINKLSLPIIYIILFAILLLYLIITLIMNPSYCLYPYNYYIETMYNKKVFYTPEEKVNVFPTSILLEKYYTKIRQEFYKLSYDKNNMWSRFTNEDEEFFNGWNTIVLRSFNKNHKENMAKCPTLSKILMSDDNITTAIFSILEPGKTLHPHYGPFKGVLRYHLGIIIPPPDAGDCYISVDNQMYEWKEGEGVLFDESYKHFATNQTNQSRVILFLDVKRPLSTGLGIINNILISLVGLY